MDGFHCVVCGKKLEGNHKCPNTINSRDERMKQEFEERSLTEKERLNRGLFLMEVYDRGYF